MPATALGDGVPLHVVMFNLDARDGVSRAVTTLVNSLVDRHPVEIISLYHRRVGPAYDLDPRIRVRYLIDHPPHRRDAVVSGSPFPLNRGSLARVLAGRPSRVSGGRGLPNLNIRTDIALWRALRTIDDGVIISTRPTLHVAAARFARPGVLTVAQDHLNFVSRARENGSLDMIREAAQRGLHAFVTLTASDGEDYRRLLAGTATRVVTIPNALSWPVSEPRPRPGHVVVAAGRMMKRKGMGRLVEAFAPVARSHPDWELRLYGDGPLEDHVQRIIDREQVGRQVRMMGHTSDLAGAMADASVFASGSRSEGFPMVMLEALSQGLPIVAFDCPRGPADIIRDGENGHLVPNDDMAAMTAALDRIVSDGESRARMGAQALADAEQYSPPRIAQRWETLLDDLVADSAVRTS